MVEAKAKKVLRRTQGANGVRITNHRGRECIAGVENEPHQLTEAIVLKVLMVSVDARLRARHA